MCPLGEKMAKIWLKLQENGEKKSQMAKVMAKEKYILARTLLWARMLQLADCGLKGLKILQACNRLWERIPLYFS